MSRRSRRLESAPKLNIKKVIASIITVIVLIMIVLALKDLFTSGTNTKEVSTLTTYFSAFQTDKWGVIDNKGNTIIKFDYDEMIIVPNENKDLFIITKSENAESEEFETVVYNAEGEEILSNFSNVQPIENVINSEVVYENNLLKFKKDGKYGLINFDGEIVLDAEYDDIYALNGVEKSIIVVKNGLEGLLSTSSNKIVIEPNYISIESLTATYENGYIVKDSNNKFGIISADSTKILECKYDEIKHVTGNNYYVVVENGKQEVIDKDCKVILSSGFDSVDSINSDNFIVIVSGKYGIINSEGKSVLECKYDKLVHAISNYYIAKQNDKFGIINSETGEAPVDFIYTNIYYIDEANFYEAENEDFTTNIINRSFETVLSNVIVSELNVDLGYLRIRVDNDYKYYNLKLEEKTNKEILSTNTLFLVKENGKYGYENKDGERIVDCIYDDAKEQNEFGYCVVNKDGKWGCLKSDGTVIVKPTIDMTNNIYIDFIGTFYKSTDFNYDIYTK